jgi:hypothetical protein
MCPPNIVGNFFECCTFDKLLLTSQFMGGVLHDVVPIVKHEAKIIQRVLPICRSQVEEGEASYAYSLRVGGDGSYTYL